jgi:lipopolysaccharide transport system ATP-binding protein
MGSITVTNLGKAYKQYPNRWARLVEWAIPQRKPRHSLHWVLQDISFRVNPGEAVGIIGINGAGKSTLLKMITGTTQPTNGSVQITGRVAALLELGMGFHPDFTGRQNAFMAGQLLGYSVEEIVRLMPEIEAFADIGDYIDQPVRVYSSGMQVRLAFSVATASRPDVLIIDEALAVGDAAFQRKCFRRIEGYQSVGTTLLFVSHDVETVKKLCDRALFIKAGRLAHFGLAKQVCDEYEKFLFGKFNRIVRNEYVEQKLPTAPTSQFDPTLVASCAMTYGNGKATISNVRIEDANRNCVNVAQTGGDLYFVFEVQVSSNDIDNPCLNMQVKTAEGVVIYGVNTEHLNEDSIDFAQGRCYLISFLLENRLAPGVYFLTCGFKEGGIASSVFCSRVVDGAVLKVVDRELSTVARGIVDLRASFDVKVLS